MSRPGAGFLPKCSDGVKGMAEKNKTEVREAVHKRIRKKIAGSAERPRLAVFRSVNHIYAQVIDDSKGETIVVASTIEPEFRRTVRREHRGRQGDRQADRGAGQGEGHQPRRVRPRRIHLSRPRSQPGRGCSRSRPGILNGVAG